MSVSPAGLEARVRATPVRSVPSLRRLRREISRELRSSSASDVFRLVEALLGERERVPRWFLYELVHHHRGAMAKLSAARLERLGRGMCDWKHVDPFGCLVSGPAWREGLVPDARVHAWARSRDRWWRRNALVSTVALNCAARGGTGDPERTLAVCEILLEDRDDMVVKAMSWALRQLAQRRPVAARRYLRARESRLAARVRRELRNKLETGVKNPRRR